MGHRETELRKFLEKYEQSNSRKMKRFNTADLV